MLGHETVDPLDHLAARSAGEHELVECCGESFGHAARVGVGEDDDSEILLGHEVDQCAHAATEDAAMVDVAAKAIRVDRPSEAVGRRLAGCRANPARDCGHLRLGERSCVDDLLTGESTVGKKQLHPGGEVACAGTHPAGGRCGVAIVVGGGPPGAINQRVISDAIGLGQEV